MNRVENEINNDLRSSLLGSDSRSGLYKLRSRKSVRFQAITRSFEDSLGGCPPLMKAARGQEKGFLRSIIPWSP